MIRPDLAPDDGADEAERELRGPVEGLTTSLSRAQHVANEFYKGKKVARITRHQRPGRSHQNRVQFSDKKSTNATERRRVSVKISEIATSNTLIFEAVAARLIEPCDGACAMLAIDNARSWKTFICSIFGHKQGIEIPEKRKPGHCSTCTCAKPNQLNINLRWMCPRCGDIHNVIGGMLPPDW